MPKLSQTKYPTISFITPTLNASAYLEKCLVSITKLKYPKSKIEIIIADGGSTDDTISIAKKYKAKIYHNKFKTSESGKAVCLRQANGEFVVLVDSDNIITDRNWLIKMIKPLILDEELVGSEPIRYTYRKYDGYIDRYCALMGMNDPLCFWLGAYDRVNTITGKWTGLNVSTIKRKGYLELRLRCGNIPTIGANGTVFRKKVLEQEANLYGDYFFDMDILESLVEKTKLLKFAKVDVGIVHLYCGSDIRKFVRKQLRRIKDGLSRRPVKDILIKTNLGQRKYNYGQKNSFAFGLRVAHFVIDCVLVVPLMIQAARGFMKQPDLVWFAHPVLCWITLLTYSRGTIESFFQNLNKELSREGWS